MLRPEAWLGAAAAVLLGVGVVVGGASADEGDAREVFTFTDPEILESSGLVVDDGLFVTVNDSGDTARVFTVDPASGDTVGVTSWDGEAVDIEALAPAGGSGGALDSGEVWVGDIGGNLAQRDSITVTRVPVGAGDRSVGGETYELVYPDGAHDAETLLADPATGRLHVVVKEFIGRVYAAPRRLDPDGPNELREIGTALGIATDGAFFADGRHLIIRNYGQAAVYTWPALERVDTFDLPQQEQGEGIAVDGGDRVYVSTEGEAQPVLQVTLPSSVRRALAPQETSAPGGDGMSGSGGDGAGDGGVQVESGTVTLVELDLWVVGLAGVAGVGLLLALLAMVRRRDAK